jgi:hypothetical protein
MLTVNDAPSRRSTAFEQSDTDVNPLFSTVNYSTAFAHANDNQSFGVERVQIARHTFRQATTRRFSFGTSLLRTGAVALTSVVRMTSSAAHRNADASILRSDASARLRQWKVSQIHA